MQQLPPWPEFDSVIGRFVENQMERTLKAYLHQPSFVEEHVGIEESVTSGGYGHRQIYELVQNAADAIEELRGVKHGFTGRVEIVLANEALYCANEGEAIDEEGAKAILLSHISRKRGSQIGHFGLGFKSVLSVSRRPEFYSRSGAFGFDAEWAGIEIRRVVQDAKATPTLRIARSLNAREAAMADGCLGELMEWAATVVKLPRDIDGTEWLSKDLEEFPAGFLLFAPHVSKLRLDDRVTNRVRVLGARLRSGIVRLSDGEDKSRWRVFRTTIKAGQLSDAARLDADPRILDRGELPLMWAVPLERQRRERGRFWAFFPTRTETTLSGILNAPWKTNADRENLLEGAFNRALIGSAIDLISEHFPELRDDRDPGSLLDVLPARSKDAPSWADRYMGEKLDETLPRVAFIPSADGKLHIPGRIMRRPERAVSSRESLDTDELRERNGTWVDWSVEQRERRSKAERFGVPEGSLSNWLNAFAPQPSRRASIRALRVVDLTRSELTDWDREEARKAGIVLSSKGLLVPAVTPNLYLPSPDDEGEGSENLVDSAISKDPACARALRWLGIERLRPAITLQRLLAEPSPNWARVWIVTRECERQEAVNLLTGFSPPLTHYGSDMRPGPRVRTRSGRFLPMMSVLLPGDIVPADDSRDPEVTIDLTFHEEDREILTRLGAVSEPTTARNPFNEDWFTAYRQEARDKLLKELPKKTSRPSWSYLKFSENTTYGPLEPLKRLSLVGRKLFTDYLLRRCLDEKNWEMLHASKPSSYPHVYVDGPICWNVKRFGAIDTSLGIRPVPEAVSRDLDKWKHLLPIAACSADYATFLGLPGSLDAISQQVWAAALSMAAEADDPAEVGSFYAAACDVRDAPAEIGCSGGVMAAPGKVAAVWDISSLSAHRSACHPAILAPDRDAAQLLITQWGLLEPAVSVGFTADDQEQFLLDVYADLSPYVPAALEKFKLQRCEDLWYEIAASGGSIRQPTLFARQAETLYFDASADLFKILDWIRSELNLSVDDAALENLLGELREQGRDAELERVRVEPDLARKLAITLGADRLRRQLPPNLVSLAEKIDDANDEMAASRLGEVALAVFGVEVLAHYASEFEDAGFNTPCQWAGSARAMEFVDDLGFPAEYAGFESARRPPSVDVDGPLHLNPLHDFQEKIAERVRRFVGETPPAKGLLSLPTGAGKTRVVVEALIRAFQDRPLTGCLVWIAQSDELCEQAVQAWSQAWRVFGLSERLRISRLWGATNNRIVPTTGQPHVVVATYQSLETRIHAPAYDWLRNAACVIVDEAHGSTTPSFTSILHGFGLSVTNTARPLIGITATPFRGAADPTETQWLVNRYGRHRFDHDVLDGDDPYSVLQRTGVLAYVEHQELAGSPLSLSPRQMEHLRQYKVLPPDVEQMLGADPQRNDRLVESICSLPSDWPVLLFSTSVEHARLLAVRLCLKGVSAKSISAETNAGARRFYVEEFRANRLRVLTNYNVLATGFDAPAVRALYITRPVYSKLLYQQMIGRGLRGPLNGGKSLCRIVNVRDNVLEFGEQLAFRHFEPLWRE